MDQELMVTIIVAVLSSTGLWTVINQHFLTAMNKKALSEKQKEEIKDILKPTNNMVLGIGYDRLIHVCNKYIEKGWIDIDELNNINKYLYTPYKELGGNGNAEMLFRKLESLPNKPKEE